MYTPIRSALASSVFTPKDLANLPMLPLVKSTEPLVGYRVWKLKPGTCELQSAYMRQYHWPLRRRIERDTFDCEGIYAVRDARQLLGRYVYDPAGIGSGPWQAYLADVAGSVYLWGEVKECELGYRAEYAYPKELWMPEDTDPCTVMQLEENYGVPVTLTTQFKKHTATDALDVATIGSWVSYKISYTVLPSPFALDSSGNPTVPSP